MRCEKQARAFVQRMFKLAYRYGVEDIEPSEMIYAVKAHEARNETAEQVAKFLWGPRA
jgi:hypothetical protein